MFPNIPSDSLFCFRKNISEFFKLFLKKFNISENNIISVELAQVVESTYIGHSPNYMGT
jgi:hypothetical protein